MKKASEDIIILHRCTINENHMMYGSCNMERDGQNFLSFWTIFFTVTSLRTPKIKIKTPADIIILHMCTISEKSYDVWSLRYEA